MIEKFPQAFVLTRYFGLVPFAAQIVAQAAVPTSFQRTRRLRCESESLAAIWIRTPIGEQSAKKALISAANPRFRHRCRASAIKTSERLNTLRFAYDSEFLHGQAKLQKA